MPYYMDNPGGTVVLEFGEGDLLIGSAGPTKGGPPNELVIWPHFSGPSLIGEINNDDVGKSTAAVQALVRLVFPDPRSLDVLIHQATELRAQMSDAPRWEAEKAICPQPAEKAIDLGNVEPLQGDDRVAVTLRLAMDELRRGKPNDRSEKDRFYAIAITDLHRLIALFEMGVRYGDDGGTAALAGDGD